MPAPADTSFLSENQTGTVYIRIAIPELKIQKCLQFELDDTVWQAKQRVLAAFSKDLRDSLNYGLYLPPVNGRAGKFLDEERFLKEYPLQGPIGFLEFKYKRRVYKVMQINPRKLKQLHTKTQLKNFLEHVKSGNIEKVVKLTNKGLDPNFHDHDSGETPLTISTTLPRDKCREMIMSIVSGGAHLDFRNKQGITPMHRAAIHGNLEAIKALLDLGASPDYKDYRNLTPLYYCVANDTNALCVEVLLHERAAIGTHDEQGWFEIHQACRYGRVQHLEHLLYYGADMDVQNASGNTPLHVCCVNNQESCARVLLFRGANKEILNYNNQTPYQVCIMANNHDLADIIKNHRLDDVVPFREIPKYSERRKMVNMTTSIRNLVRCRSDPRLNLSMLEEQFLKGGMNNHSLSMNDQYDNGSYPPSREYNSDSPRSLSISSSSSGPARRLQHRSLYARRHQALSALTGRAFVCVGHNVQAPYDMSIKRLRPTHNGQLVEVLSVGDQGFYEGRVEGRENWFSGAPLQDGQLRRAGSMGNLIGDTVTMHRNTLAALVQQSNGGEYAPKTVLLHRSPEGYGFVLRGARSQSASSSLEFQPCPEFPALQYLDSVDPGSQSDRAGLKTGDFILEINGENVVRATHERVVQLIRTSKDVLVMKVITARPVEKSSDWFTHQDGSMTLPNRKKQAPLPPKRNPDTSLSYSKATSKSMAEGLAEIEKLDQTLAEFDKTGNRRHSLSTNELAGEQKTASVRGSHAMKRVSCVDINHIVVGDHIEPAEPTYDTPSVQRPKEYMSPAEQRIKKYHKKHNGTMERSKSTPDLAGPDEVVYASTSMPGSGVAIYNRSPVNRSHVTYQKPNSPGHYGQGHVAEVKRPQSHIDSDRLKSAVYAGPVVVRKNVEDADSPVIPVRAPVPKRQAPNPPNKSEVVSISTSRNDNMYANVSAEIQARKQSEKEESPYESSFRPGTLARLTNQPRVTTASLEQAKLKSHRKTNSMGAINVQAEEERGTDDKVMQNAAAFIQKHPNAKLLVTADVHQKKYYEPEPDYDNESDDERSLGSASSLRAQGAISRQSSVTSGSSKSTEDAKMLALEAQKSVRPKSTSVTVISVGDATIKKSSPVTERHYAVHSDIPSAKKSVNSDTTNYGESKITIKSSQPAEQSSIVTQSNVTTIQTGHYSSQTNRPASSSTPVSSINNSRRSSIQSNQSGGKEVSSENNNITHIPVAPPPPKHTTPPSPKHPVSLSSQYSAPPSPQHTTPPPQAPPPPPPPPAPPAPPPIPTTLPPTYSQETLNKTPPKPEPNNKPLVSASDIMNAVKLRQNRIDNDSPRMSQTKPSQAPPVKSSIDLNQEALKAAVAARKSRLQQSQDTAVVDQIESRLQKTKKLQSAKYFFSSDTIKTEPTAKEDDKSQATLTRPTKKAPAPDPPVVSSKPKSPQVAGKSKQISSPAVKAEAPKSPAPKPDESTQSNDFLARAEKARQEILQKKSGGSKSQSVTPIYSSGGSKSTKKIDTKPVPADQSKEDEQMSIKDKIASFEKQKKANGGVSNGNNIELDGVTEDHSHTEAGNTLTRNGSSAYASSVVAPPPGFTDTLDIIPPPVNFSNDASVDSGHGSDHYNSAFGHDDSASLVSSASTLSTLSSEHGEHTANRTSHYDDILPPPPPAFCDNINDFEDIPSDVIPPPPQFSNSNDNKPKPLRPYQTKSVDSWLCTDVLDWLDSLNMAQYKSSFAKNCIDGPKLLTLGRNDYIELGVTQVGHRMNLERSIKKVALGKISTAM